MFSIYLIKERWKKYFRNKRLWRRMMLLSWVKPWTAVLRAWVYIDHDNRPKNHCSAKHQINQYTKLFPSFNQRQTLRTKSWHLIKIKNLSGAPKVQWISNNSWRKSKIGTWRPTKSKIIKKLWTISYKSRLKHKSLVPYS